MRKTLPLICVALLTCSLLPTLLRAQTNTTIVGWNFNASLSSNTGITGNTGIAINAVGVGASPFASGLGCTGGEALCNNWTSGDRWQSAAFTTVGATNLTYSFKQASTSGGATNFKFQYSLNGSSWVNLISSYSIPINNGCSPWYTAANVALPSVLENQSTVYLRWETSSNGNGLNRLDEVYIIGDFGTACNVTASVLLDSNVNCSNGLGGLTASASGGAAPYSYLWSNGATTAIVTGLVAGTYSVAITDNNGCVDSASGIVSNGDYSPPVAQAKSVVNLYLDANGLATLTSAMVDSGSSDNCAIDTMSISRINFDCSDVEPTAAATSFSFNGGALPTGWTASPYTVSSSTCPGKDSPDNSDYFWATATASSGSNIGKRFVQTNAVDVSLGGNVEFYIRYGNNEGSGCEQPDASSEEVYLQYSVDAGANWVNIYEDWNTTSAGNYDWYLWHWNSIPIPTGAKTTNTIFRWFQPSNSGTNFDNWGLEDVSINAVKLLGATLTVADTSNNQNSTNFEIDVHDTISPIAIAQDLTVYLDANGEYELLASAVDNGSSDACAIVEFQLSKSEFSCADVGTNTILFTATDTYGNIGKDSATITVLDTISPKAIGKDITVTLDSTGQAVVTSDDFLRFKGPLSVQMNTYGANYVLIYSSDLPGVAYNDLVGKYMRVDTSESYKLYNYYNGGSIYYYYIDGPSYSATPSSLQAFGMSGIKQDVYFNERTLSAGTENCAVTQFVISQDTFDCNDLGVNSISISVTDASGNTKDTTVVVTVEDGGKPQVFTQNINAYLDASGMVSITASEVDSASFDFCGIDTLILDQYNFSCVDTGSNLVYLKALDLGGSVDSAQAIVTVLDTIKPTAQTKDYTVYLNTSGNASILAADIDSSSADACGIDTLILSQYDFDCNDLGTSTVYLTVTDIHGNAAMAPASIAVMDTVKPNVVVQNGIAYLDANGNVSVEASQIDNGSSDICGLDTLTLSQYDFDCSHIGVNTLSLTAVDVSSNAASANAMLTIIDSVKPTLAIQSITVYLDANGNATITASQLDNGSTDACGIDTLLLSAYNFDCSHIGNNTITFTATDNNANSASASVTVSVLDTIKPLVATQNTIVYLDATGMGVITESDVENGSTDACGISSSGLSQYNFGCTHLGANTVYLTVTDANGNKDSTTAIVTVLDTVSPTALIKSVTAYLDINGSATVTANDVNNGSSDNCAYTLALSQTTFDCTETGLNLKTFTITDTSGNSASNDVLITIKDTISPSLHLKKSLIVSLDQFGNATISAAQLDSASSDNCSNLLFFNVSKTAFNCTDLGDNQVVVTAFDNKNNSSTGMSIVKVVDYIAPVVNTQNVTAYLNASGVATIDAQSVNNNTADNCAVDSVWLDKTNFTCIDLGQNVVKLYVNDQSGNQAQANAVVTVVDTISPVVITQNVTTYLNANGQASITAADLNDGSTDNCSIGQMSLSQSNFSCADIGIQTVGLTIADAYANSSTALATVTVIDTISPVVNTKNITVALDANGVANITAADIDNGSMDACGIESMTIDISSFSCVDLGPNKVILTVSDDNQNTSTKTATVTVIDNVSPTVSTQNITIYLDANGDVSIMPADIDNGSSDNCGITSYSLDIDVFDCADLGQNLVVLTATDISNNSGSKSAFVTVLDTITPSIDNLPANITVYATGSQCAANVQWTAITGSDNCNVTAITTSKANGSVFPLGSTAVNVTAADASGNTITQSFDITVLDTVAPMASNVPSNYTVVPNIGSCDAVVNWIEPVAIDNCGGVAWTKSHLPGASFPVGNTTVTYTATDSDNNATTVSFVVEVIDVIFPSFTNVPTNITLGADKGSCSVQVNFALPAVSDNCTGVTLSSSHLSGSIFPLGTTTVTFTATDGANNVTSASFTVTVVDNQKPKLTSIPANDTVGSCGATYTFTSPTATDNCSAVSITQIAGLASGSIYPAGVTVNAFRISDANGNDTTVSFSVVVVPQGMPNLPSILEICEHMPAVDMSLGQNLSWTGPGVIANGTSFDPLTAGTGRHKLDYTFVDQMGCSVSGSIYITVLPQPLKPVISKVGSTTLTTGNFVTYQWYLDGVAISGAVSQNYSYIVGGNYQVMVTNNSGCDNYSDGVVIGKAKGGIGVEEEVFGNLDLYPNPSAGLITIDLNRTQTESISVSIVNAAGKQVFAQTEQTTQEGKLRLDLSHLPNAAYIVHIRSGSQSVVKRVVLY